MAKTEFYGAMFGIIKNEKGEILFGKRKNTGYRDGKYQLPSGHLEGNETMVNCMIRELKEEIGIDVIENDCELVHLTHRDGGGNKVYFNGYFNINNYSQKIKNLEPHKCEELVWADRKRISSDELFSYDREILEYIDKGESFSETIHSL